MTFDNLRQLKTLLIDDDEFVRDSLRVMFESKGCFLQAVETAEEAIHVLDIGRYDLVITDYKLPGMNGLDFCRRLQESHPNVVKILITAYGSQSVKDEANDVGVSEFIEKPITPKSIEASLSRLFKGTT
jgi:CheY-like chemotaxis protein